jgi:Tol biopolymer transport system component
MNEDRLRDALQSQAPRRAPTDGSWDDVRDRARHLHRRRRFAQSAVALVTVIAVLLGVLAVAGTFEGNTDHAVVATPSGADGEIVAALDRRIVVMTADGEILRTVIDDVDIAGGTISTSPDGRFVYFGRSLPCTNGIGDYVEPVRVALSGGDPQRVDSVTFPIDGKDVGSNAEPLVSPDGHWVAFDMFMPACGARAPNAGAAIAGTDTGGVLSVPGIPLAWSPDSAHVLWKNNVTIFQVTVPASLDLSAIDATRSQPVDWTAPDITAVAYTRDGEVLVARGVLGTRSDYSVSDLANNVRYTAPGPTAQTIALDARDRLLARLDDGTLQVQEGNARPRTIGVGVRAAAWLPTAAAAPPVPTTTTTAPTTTTAAPSANGRPAHVFALTTTGDVVELDSSDGRLIRTIAHVDAPPDASIAVTPDGKTAYTEKTQSGTCDPRIAKIDVATGTFSVIADGRHPAVSPDGRLLAYVRTQCDAPSTLIIRDLASGRETELAPGPEVNVNGRLSFAPDSWHLTVEAPHAPNYDLWLLDARATPDGAPTRVVNPGLDFGMVPSLYLGNTGLLVGGVPTSNNGDSQVVTLDPSSGDLRILVDFPGAQATVVSSDASGTHLLLRVVSADGTQRLFRWSIGAAAPQALGVGMPAGAWLP